MDERIREFVSKLMSQDVMEVVNAIEVKSGVGVAQEAFVTGVHQMVV